MLTDGIILCSLMLKNVTSVCIASSGLARASVSLVWAGNHSDQETSKVNLS